MSKLKFKNAEVVFKEIPDEITLAINITNCPYHCDGCHSPWLQKNVGKLLTKDRLDKMIKDNQGITCVCFMGGDSNVSELRDLAYYIKHAYNLKTAWYSGQSQLCSDDSYWFNYVKIGPYIKELGGLDKLTTNQHLYRLKGVFIEDITYKLR